MDPVTGDHEKVLPQIVTPLGIEQFKHRGRLARLGATTNQLPDGFFPSDGKGAFDFQKRSARCGALRGSTIVLPG